MGLSRYYVAQAKTQIHSNSSTLAIQMFQIRAGVTTASLFTSCGPHHVCGTRERNLTLHMIGTELYPSLLLSFHLKTGSRKVVPALNLLCLPGLDPPDSAMFTSFPAWS